MSTVAVVYYSGTYKGAPVSGSVPVWSRPNSPDEVARLLYAVITGRSLHTEGRRVNWTCGESDFVAHTPRGAVFLRFTFRVDHKGDSLPTECDEVAASMSDKAPHFATFDEASRWVRARMPGESMTVIDNTAESLMASQRKPTPAPTFTDDVPEPAFDILSDQSGNGARRVVIFRLRYQSSVDFVSNGESDLAAYAPCGRRDVVAWQSFETADGWSWGKTEGYQNPDCDPLFL